MSIEIDMRIMNPKHTERVANPSSDLHFPRSSTIFEHTMTEIVENPIEEAAKLPHRGKVLRAMHGGSKPEAIPSSQNDDIDESFTDLIEGTKTESPELIAKKLGAALNRKFRPFRTADKGRESIVLEDEENPKLAKVDKFSPPKEVRDRQAKVSKVIETFTDGRIAPSEPFEAEGYTGVIADKVELHPRFEEARQAAKNGDPTLWNEIIDKDNGGYFSDVLDELEAVGIDAWNTPLLDADERDNYVTNKKRQQIFVDSIWIDENNIDAKRMIARMKAHPEKYTAEQQARVKAALRDLETPEEASNSDTSREIKTITREVQHVKTDYAA